MSEEIWRDIESAREYAISSHGRVRFSGGWRAFGINKRYAKPNIRKLQPHSGGYAQVVIKGKNLFVHRLVAIAFLDPVEGCLHVNHKNGDKTDNRAENLEWVTSSQNHLHKTRVLKKGAREGHSQAKLTQAKVDAIRASKESVRALAAQYGVTESHIRLLRAGKICVWMHD